MSMMTLYIPHMEAVEDVVVECMEEKIDYTGYAFNDAVFDYNDEEEDDDLYFEHNEIDYSHRSLGWNNL